MLRDALNPQLQACELVAGLLPETAKVPSRGMEQLVVLLPQQH